jgi:hypothetical protein
VNRLESLLRFIWDFVIGDDWRIAAGVVLALGATALIAGTHFAGTIARIAGLPPVGAFSDG